MAADKLYRRLEAKIDALLEKANLKPADFDNVGVESPQRSARELTEAEKQAIANAPKAEAAPPPAERGPRVTAQNAPDTSSSTPPTEKASKGSDSKKK